MASKTLSDISIMQIQIFLEIAEKRSFSKAAESLCIEQPTLSRQIIKLENSLGIRLFDRECRPIKLSSAGEVLYEKWKLLLSDFEDSIDEYMWSKDKITICTQPYLRIVQALPGFQGYLHAHGQNYSLEFKYMNISVYYDALKNNEADMALSVAAFYTTKHEDLVYERICDYPFMVSVLMSNPLSKKESITAEDLKGMNFITIGTHVVPNLQQSLDALLGPDPVRNVRTVNSPLTIASALQSDTDVAIYGGHVLSSASPDIKSFELPGHKMVLYAIRRKNYHHPLYDTVVSEMRKFFGSSDESKTFSAK